MKLIANKRMFYATRRLLPGDEFEAKLVDAKILMAVGKAHDPNARQRAEVPPPPPELVAAVPELVVPDPAEIAIDALRAEAVTLGITIDGRWGEARLQQEIVAAKVSEAIAT